MSSEIERALARRDERQEGVDPPGPAFGRATEGDSLVHVLEMSGALTATIDLREGVQGVLEILERHPRIARCAVTLELPDRRELVIDGPNRGVIGDGHRFVCSTVSVGGKPIGALAVDLIPQRDEVREHTEALVEAAAELIGQAVQLHQLLAPRDDPDPIPVPPGTSLAELVAGYERGLIERALRATRGNRSRAARLLRTTERIVGYRVQQYGIDCSLFRG